MLGQKERRVRAGNLAPQGRGELMELMVLKGTRESLALGRKG